MNKLAQDKITNEIMLCTIQIEKNKPALYKLLSETPLFQSERNSDISWNDFSEYLESLQKQYEEFGNTIKSTLCY